MSTLHDFAEVDAPEITEKQWVHHPTRQNKIMGTLGMSNRDSPCFVAQRTRHNDSEVQDYYRKIGGYSLVTTTAKALLNKGVGNIFIEETDNDRFVEYETSVFLSQGEELDDWKGQEQICCPISAANYTWEMSEVNISRMKGKR